MNIVNIFPMLRSFTSSLLGHIAKRRVVLNFNPSMLRTRAVSLDRRLVQSSIILSQWIRSHKSRQREFQKCQQSAVYRQAVAPDLRARPLRAPLRRLPRRKPRACWKRKKSFYKYTMNCRFRGVRLCTTFINNLWALKSNPIHSYLRLLKVHPP